jgi:class 3 adenylate cyclase
MFGDLEGFTKRVENMSAEEIVDEIHEFFSGIDDIMIKYGIEKIKTIGDAYMCAAGLSETPDPSGALRMIEASRDIFAFLKEFNQRKEIEQKKPLNLRIGIHSGPVIAGVVGKSKFAYDIWGDTVNTASRLETAGQAGKINISAKTYEQVKDHFKCIPRGKLEAKNKGLIEMFFVDLGES